MSYIMCVYNKMLKFRIVSNGLWQIFTFDNETRRDDMRGDTRLASTRRHKSVRSTAPARSAIL